MDGMKMNRHVVCTSGMTGLSVIGWTYLSKEPHTVEDVYTVKMVMNPESGERYFSFAPLMPLANKQSMTLDAFERLANSSINSGVYQPEKSVKDAYFAFIDSEDRKECMSKFYLEECGPSKKWVDAQNENRGVAGTIKTERSGNVIKGPFACVEEE